MLKNLGQSFLSHSEPKELGFCPYTEEEKEQACKDFEALRKEGYKFLVATGSGSYERLLYAVSEEFEYELKEGEYFIPMEFSWQK